MTKRAKSYPVAPNAVYVWRGFMVPGSDYQKFAQFLGSIFVPACALLQPSVGLRAYLPTMVPQNQKPPAVPDQTALMFWATPQAHDEAGAAIAVRIYQELHGGVYDMTRPKLEEVPVALSTVTGALQADQPYFLFDEPADWMLGASITWLAHAVRTARRISSARPMPGRPHSRPSRRRESMRHW